MAKHLPAFIDTNVWLDYYLGRQGADDATSALLAAISNEDAIVVTIPILKDTFFLLQAALKHRIREETGHVNETDAHAVNEIAWACIRDMASMSCVIDTGVADHLEACILQGVCSDYEDAILIAAAQRTQVDYIVTGDKGLLANGVVGALTPAEYASKHA